MRALALRSSCWNRYLHHSERSILQSPNAVPGLLAVALPAPVQPQCHGLLRPLAEQPAPALIQVRALVRALVRTLALALVRTLALALALALVRARVPASTRVPVLA